MKDANPDRNRAENTSGKGWSPPSGKPSGGQKLSQHPPRAGAHTPVGGVHKIVGDVGGKQVIHPSLRKPGLMK